MYLMGYGTGAIMAVPGHDDRDMEFAKKFGLEIIKVVDGGTGAPECFVDDGIAVNSANDEVSLNGLTTPEAKKTIISWLERKQPAGWRSRTNCAIGSSPASGTGGSLFLLCILKMVR